MTVPTAAKRRAHTVIESPIGPLTLIAHDGRCAGVLMEVNRYDPSSDERGEVVGRDGEPVLAAAAAQLDAYFAGELTAFDLPLTLDGTGFQRTVWTGLQGIPYGQTISYGELAEADRPAVRVPRGRPGERQEPGFHRGSVPPRNRRRWQPHRIWRRDGTQAVPARPRRAGQRPHAALISICISCACPARYRDYWAAGRSAKSAGQKALCGVMEFGTHGVAGEELNAFVGRERELSDLRQVAAEARAVTLCGAGGIGKTRLAVHLAASLAAGFPDGAWFVGLADLREPELVASRIAAELGVVEEPGRPLLATVADALRPRRALIVLDNCEHLIDACAHVCQRLLAGAPGLRIITTSREPLRVAAETVWQVPPMAMPDQQEPPGPGLLDSDAVRLFADRASAAKPDVTLSPANLAAAAAICRAVDGLPLAIELAAAWVGVLNVEQIATRLQDRFRLLSTASRMAPQRHRTLRAAIDWSHDLLSAPEKVLLRRLSVFAGWPLDMAEQVCASDDKDGEALPAGEVLDLLTGLADKSLVIAEPDVRGEFRYRMLDTIRDYAAARLTEAAETEMVRARFRRYAVAEVEHLALIGMAIVPATWATRVSTFRRFEAETANLRQLLSWCLASGDAESGLRICVSMRPVWIVQGSFAEGTAWMDRFLALESGLPARVLGPALVGRAQLALVIDHAEAARRARAGLALCREPGLEFWAASALNLLAEVALKLGQIDEAEAQAAEAMTLATGAGDGFNAGYAGGTRATVAAYRGDVGAALRLGEMALAVAREIDQQWAVARTLLGLGDLARLTGDPVQARQRYREAFTILREVNARPEMARCLAGLGRIEITQGELIAAREYFAESLELSRATGSRIGVIRGLDSFAALAMAQGRPERAVELTAAAAVLRRAAHLPEPPAGRIERLLKESDLAEAVVKELWEAGSELGGDAAVELALEPLEAAAPAASEDLTARELQVAAAIARGLGNKAIASELGIAPATVARHVANIMAKLDFGSRAQIASWAASHGY